MYSYWYKYFLELTSGTFNYHDLAVHNEDFIKSDTDELESRFSQAWRTHTCAGLRPRVHYGSTVYSRDRPTVPWGSESLVISVQMCTCRFWTSGARNILWPNTD